MKLILFVCLGVSFAFGQVNPSPVNYDDIYQNITQDQEYNYSSLLDRYQAYDSLSLEEYRHLYYGYTFQENYKPFEEDTLGIQISSMLTKGIDDTSVDTLISLANTYLSKNPFSLKMMYYLQHFYQAKQEFPIISSIQTNYDGVVRAILSSGDGLQEETGFSVNTPSDEHMVMRSLGFRPVTHDFKPTHDFYKLEENQAGYEGIFFDVTRLAMVGTQQMGIETVEIDEEDKELLKEGIEIGSPEEVLEFVLTGRQVLYQKKVDLNYDGLQDWIVITNKKDENILSNFAANDPEKRELIVLIRKENLLLEEQFRNENAILCIDCGTKGQDPFQSIEVVDNYIVIHSKGGDLYKWERTSSFEYIDGEYVLTYDEFVSYREGSQEKRTEVETEEDFGKIPLQEFDAYQDLQ